MQLKAILPSFFLPLLIIFFALPSFAIAETCPNSSDNPCWISKSPMPTARRAAGITTDVNGNIYVVGGFDGSGGFLTTLEKYDPQTDIWTTLTPMHTPRNGLGFVKAPNNKLYALGGFNGSGSFPNSRFDEVDEYDPITNNWTIKSPMPTARFGMGVLAAPNGKIYAIGGTDTSELCIATVEEYDPAIDTWTTKTPMPTERCWPAVAVAPNGKIYAIGGHKDHRFGNVHLATVEEYDPITDTWATKSSMPTPRSTLGVSLNSEGKIYAVGGNTESNYVNVIEEYNPVTDIWSTKTSFPVAIHEFGLVLSTNGTVYAIGGQTLDDPAVNINYAGTIPIATPTPTPIPTMPVNMDECKKGRWLDFLVFKNQGACVSFVEKMKHFLHI